MKKMRNWKNLVKHKNVCTVKIYNKIESVIQFEMHKTWPEDNNEINTSSNWAKVDYGNTSLH